MQLQQHQQHYIYNYNYNALRYTALHPAVVGDVTTATTPKNTTTFGPSVDSLCHPRITTTHLSYSFLSLKLPPPPCAALLVGNASVNGYGWGLSIARFENRHISVLDTILQAICWWNQAPRPCQRFLAARLRWLLWPSRTKSPFEGPSQVPPWQQRAPS